MTPLQDPPWWARANCRGMDTSIFFPERGDQRSVTEAKTVCRGCEVRADCLEEHLREKEGIWAGTTERDRRRILRERRSVA